MADNFLQAALSLLNRPGNTVRGALIDGPGGAWQGLTGDRNYDPTELPFVNQMPDEGPELGPLHLTPRTLAGFGAGTVLDPLTYLGGFIGKAGAGLARGAEAGLDLLGDAGRMTPELEGAFQGGITHPHFMDTLRQGGLDENSPLGDIIDHLNANHPQFQGEGKGITLGGDDGLEHATTRVSVTPGWEPRAQIPPASEARPIGDQRYAQAKDRLSGVQAQLGELNGEAIPARQWLTETSQADVAKPAETWEDVVGVKRGTDPSDPSVLAAQENPRMLRESSPDLGEGPGLTADHNGETAGFSRDEVMKHLAALESQISELTTKLKGTGGRYGDPLEKRGMENTLSDWQAKRQMAADPSLMEAETGNARRSYEQWAAKNGKTPRPGLSDKQMQMAQNKTGQQLSREESFRRAPDSRYTNRGNPEASPDEANMGIPDEAGRHAPHGDPLEEERAIRAQEEKFGRRGPGTNSPGQTDLGVDQNERPGGTRDVTQDVGLVDHLGRDTATDPRAMPVSRTRSNEPTAGMVAENSGPQRPVNPQFDEQGIQAEAEMAQLRHAIQRALMDRLRPSSFLGR